MDLRDLWPRPLRADRRRHALPRARRGRARSARRWGCREDLTTALAGLVWGWSVEGVGEKQAPSSTSMPRTGACALALDLASKLIGTPRHLSQHPGGFVLTHDRLDDLVPIEPARWTTARSSNGTRTTSTRSKFMKVDVLGLGMLGCMNRAFNLLEEDKGVRVGMADLQDDDPAVYAMIQKADTLGVFQIESRAQMSMLPRMKPDAISTTSSIEVAIVRPGPDPGRHGPSLSAPARRQGEARISAAPNCARCSRRRSACRCSRSRR